MVRVDFQIDFVESEDVGTERNYIITVDEVEVDRGIVTFEQSSLYVVVDEIERGTHQFIFSLDAPNLTPWNTKIYAWNQQPSTTPPRGGEMTLLGEGNVSVGIPLTVPFEANPGPPPWAPGLYYKNIRERVREIIWGPEGLFSIFRR